MRVLSFGEIVCDIFDDKKFLGGAPLNFAALITMLGNCASLVSAVGEDELGKAEIKRIHDHGVGTENLCITAAAETGKCIVCLVDNLLPSYYLSTNSAYDYIEMPTIKEKTDVIVFGTLALRKQNNREVLFEILKKHSFTEVFCDVNIRKPFFQRRVCSFVCQMQQFLKSVKKSCPLSLKLPLVKRYRCNKLLKSFMKNSSKLKSSLLQWVKKVQFAMIVLKKKLSLLFLSHKCCITRRCR